MKKLTDQQYIDLQNEYLSDISTSCGKLAKKFNLTTEGVCSILKRRGVRIRKINRGMIERKYNESFFEKIDNEEKAYFLGLLYADGCVCNNRIQLSLQERDRSILERCLIAISANFNLYYNTHPSKKGSPNIQNSYLLAITSKKMCQDLINLGCIPRKSLILKFPTEEQVPKHLISHFIRGYYDGDGTLHIGYNGEGTVVDASITSTFIFCQEIAKITKEEIGIQCYLYTLKNKITTKLSTGSIRQSMKFLDWLYKDATIYLDRKYIKYMSFRMIPKTKGQCKRVKVNGVLVERD